MKKYLFVGVLVATLFIGAAPVFAEQSAGADLQYLQAQISSLLATIKSLQTELAAIKSGGSDSTGTAERRFCYNWSRNLRVGDENSDVTQLVIALNKEGALSGKTDTFDEEVASAVVEFQEKYTSEILTPNNLRRGTGFVGVSTRAKLNQLYGCKGPTPPVIPPVTTYCPPDTSPSSGLPCVIRPTKPSATITTSRQITALEPYITGVASGVSQVGITISNSGGKVYGSGLVPVVNGNWSVTVSPALTLGQYTINVYDANNNLLTSSPLNIVSSVTTQSSITVLAPNGGESWAKNTVQTIKWRSQGIPSGTNVNVYIQVSGGFCNVGSNVVESGGTSFTLNDTGDCYYSTNSQYKIAVYAGGVPLDAQGTSNANTFAKDSSDSSFTITAPTSSGKFQPADTNQDGRISIDEVTKYASLYGNNATAQEATLIWKNGEKYIKISSGFIPTHPADTNADGRISIDEVTAYGAKYGNTAEAQNAGAIWRKGGDYTFNSTGWVPLNPTATSSQPSIDRIEPTSGSGANPQVTVYGSGFTSASEVLVGDNVTSAKPLYVSPDGRWLTFLFPAATAQSILPSSTYSVRVSNVGNVSVASGLASNPKIFTITTSTTEPSITIDGSQNMNSISLVPGQTFQFHWTLAGLTLQQSSGAGVQLLLLDQNKNQLSNTSAGVICLVCSSTNNSGWYNCVVPSGLSTGQYYIKAATVGGTSPYNVSATSLTPLTITSPTSTTQPSITASPTSGTLSGTSSTLWVDFVVNNYTPNGTEMVDFGDGTRSALGYTTAYNSRHDYHSSGTYNVRLFSGINVIATTQVIVTPASITQPSITVLSPNGGETWEVGKSYDFKWTSQNVDKVSVNLDNLDNGIRYAAVSNIDASKGAASFTVPSVNLPPGKYKALITEIYYTPTPGAQDASDAYFTIIAPIPAVPTVTSLSPTSGPAGTRVTVKGTGFSKTAINYIDFNNGQGGANFSSGSIDGATLIFTAPNYTYGDYKVYVSNDENGFSTTYQTFTITAPSATTQPSLAVANPNGGETLTIGNQYEIRWSASNMPSTANFSVNLLDENGTVSKGRIAYGLGSSAGSYNWTVGTVYADSDTGLTTPQTIPAGRYRVQVKSGTGVNNMSNSSFTIAASASTSGGGGSGTTVSVNQSTAQMAGALEGMRIELQRMLQSLGR